MTNVVNKIFVDKMGGRSTADYIGIQGDLFYDPAVGELRISDGSTSGGKSLINSQSLGSYRTFQAGVNVFRNTNDQDIAQIIIHNAPAKVDYINFTDNTDNDDFYVTGLQSQYVWGYNRNADKVIAVNLYGKSGSLNDSDMRYFVRKFIDTILYNEEDYEVNDVNEAKQRFYDNITALTQALPDGSLFDHFAFDDRLRYHNPEYTATGDNTSAQFAIKMDGEEGQFYPSYDDDGVDFYMYNSGSNYSVGDTLVAQGSQLGGLDEINDLTLTVVELKNGNATSLTMTSGGTGFRPFLEFSNNLLLEGGNGSGARISISTVDSNGVIVDWYIQEDGQDYQVGDVLTVNVGGDDASFTVASVGTDAIGWFDVAGTGYYGSPARVPNGYWPKVAIDDGSDDQYDWGNQLSTNTSMSAAVVDIDGNKMTITNWVKEGTAEILPGTTVFVKYNDADYYGWVVLVAKATDNSDIWYIEGEYNNGTDLEVRFDAMPYGGGEVVTDRTFNPASDSQYAVVYDQSVFAMIAFGVDTDSFYYNGNMGADGTGYKEIFTLLGANPGDFQSRMIPQVKASGTYILKESDIGKHIYGATDVVIPIESAANFPIGTAITVVSKDAWTYVYADNSVVTQVYGAGYDQTNNNFYIPNNSIATILKVDADKWMLSGAGLAID